MNRTEIVKTIDFEPVAPSFSILVKNVHFSASLNWMAVESGKQGINNNEYVSYIEWSRIVPGHIGGRRVAGGCLYRIWSLMWSADPCPPGWLAIPTTSPCPPAETWRLGETILPLSTVPLQHPKRNVYWAPVN